MSCVIPINHYTVEEQDAALVLCQLRWCGMFFNGSGNELTVPLSPASPSPSDSSLTAAVTPTPTDPLPGPSSAPDMEVSDCDSNVRSKYKLNLFERYKQEQREWALATQSIRVTAGDRPAAGGMPSRADRRPSGGRVESRSVGVVTPRFRTNVRRTVKQSIIATLLNEEPSEDSDSDTSEETVPEEESSRKTKIGNITVSNRLLQQLGSMKANKATRKLLTEVFPRRVLATHSLTGRPSPAFPNKPVKKRLNPDAVKTIIDLVVERCRDGKERDVRQSITTKLADECKMQRHRLRRETEV